MSRHNEAQGARALWAEVLALAVKDARRDGDLSYLETEDFALVASLAGIEPDAARRAVAGGDGPNP